MTYKQFCQYVGKQFTVTRTNDGPVEPFTAKLIGNEAGFLVLRKDDGSTWYAETYNCQWPTV